MSTYWLIVSFFKFSSNVLVFKEDIPPAFYAIQFHPAEMVKPAHRNTTVKLFTFVTYMIPIRRIKGVNKIIIMI